VAGGKRTQCPATGRGATREASDALQAAGARWRESASVEVGCFGRLCLESDLFFAQSGFGGSCDDSICGSGLWVGGGSVGNQHAAIECETTGFGGEQRVDIDFGNPGLFHGQFAEAHDQFC